MDQKRLFLAIAISIAILLGFQVLIAPHLPQPPKPPPQIASSETTPTQTPTVPAQGSSGAAAATAGPTVPKQVPRLQIAAHRVRRSISLLGARIDDLVLTDYRETLEPNSPDVRLLEPRSEDHPYYVQDGWSAAPGEQVKLPDNDTVWTASADTLSTGDPVALSWDNGAGLTFQITLSIDDDYMFAVQQSVKNATDQTVKLFPWSRIRRDYTPEVAGYYILFEGLLGFVDGKLQNTYSSAKSEKTYYDHLALMFEQKYPNVKIHRITTAFTSILQQQKLVLSGSNPPDIIQSNQGYGTLGPEAAAHLIIPLDKYAKQYHWSSCQPATILQGNRFTSDGKHFGSGSLYGASDVVGGPVAVYYNKAKLRALGVKLPFTDLAEFEAALAKAKAAGDVPIEYGALEKWPGIHEFQSLWNIYAPNKQDLLNYVFGTAPATLNTPWALQAATTLQTWAKDGYFENGFNGLSYNSAWPQFAKGGSLFLISGPWLNGGIDQIMKNNVGVFLMPPLHAGQPAVATNSGNNSYVIAAKSKNQDIAAAYLNFITCSKEASAYFLKEGQTPLYLPAGVHLPTTGSSGDWIRAWNTIRKSNGSIMFMDLSTLQGTNIIGQTIQELTGLQITPQQAINKIESDYAQFHKSLK